MSVKSRALKSIVMHLRNPVIESPLICSKLSIDRLLKWPNAPSLWQICRVCPHPFTRPKDVLVALERPRASEGPRIMHAAGVTQRVISDQKVVRLRDDLEDCQYFAAERDRGSCT